jgi:glycosyltransferase 2 family protein
MKTLVETKESEQVARWATRHCETVLRRLGIPLDGTALATHQFTRRLLLVGIGGAGRLRIATWRRRDAVARFVGRLWDAISMRESPTLLPLTLRGQVEQEARVEQRARERQAAVPGVISASASCGTAVLIEELPDGRTLAELPREQVDDALLDGLWSCTRALHDAGIVHGHLDAHHMVITSAGPFIVGFEAAWSTTRTSPVARDVAQLLAATAAIVGPERAVRSSARVLGDDAVARALAYVQPAALSGWTHDAFGGRHQLDAHLTELRTSAEEALAADLAPPEGLYRVHPRTVLMAVGTLVAVATLLTRVGSPAAFWHAVRGADWALVVFAFAMGMLRDVVYGITFLGNVPVRIPIWPSIELQIAMAFSNLAVPVAADSAIQVRFLHRNGLDVPTAIATGGVLSSLTEIAVQIGLFVLAIRLAPDRLRLGTVDTTRLEIAMVAVGCAIALGTGVVIAVRRVRRLVLPPVRRAVRAVWHAVTSPARLALLIGGNVTAQLLTVVSVLACLWAFGAHVDFWTATAITIGVGLLASLVPFPGGGIAVSAIGLAAAFTAVGVHHGSAVAAVLAYQLAHSYVPAIPGWFATHDLVRKRLL